MAISYTVPNTFAALTLAESAKVNANETYTKSIFDGIEATTTTFAKIKVDANPATALEVATKQYVDYYATLRRPRLIFASATTVTVEAGINGTDSSIPILFPDGSLRTETTSTRTTFDITRNAVLTTASAQSGLRTSLSESGNTWYALYAVKVTDSSTQWCTVGDTRLPLQANYANLNSSFGTSGWVYLGLIRNGDNAGATGDILDFVMTSGYTVFKNTNNGGSPSIPLTGNRMADTAGATTLTYTYSAGTGSTSIPDNITIVDWKTSNAAIGGNVIVKDSGAARTYFQQHGNSAASMRLHRSSASEGVNLSNGPASSVAYNICLSGFHDGALGVGANPLL